MIRSIFVYGTLKRGQCRAGLWPVAPLSVRPAWTSGRLFGRDDYPAMVAGGDRVLGELWQFEMLEMSEVLDALDRIEGTNQPGFEDLYIRVTVPTWRTDDRMLETAFAYHYARDPSDDGFQLIQPRQPDRGVSWPSDAIHG